MFLLLNLLIIFFNIALHVKHQNPPFYAALNCTIWLCFALRILCT